jgi:hypothetical protein
MFFSNSSNVFNGALPQYCFFPCPAIDTVPSFAYRNPVFAIMQCLKANDLPHLAAAGAGLFS